MPYTNTHKFFNFGLNSFHVLLNGILDKLLIHSDSSISGLLTQTFKITVIYLYLLNLNQFIGQCRNFSQQGL